MNGGSTSFSLILSDQTLQLISPSFIDQNPAIYLVLTEFIENLPSLLGTVKDPGMSEARARV